MSNETFLVRKGGYRFYFQDGDNQIACLGSYFTGKEEVYINDDLISTKRSFGFKSVHQFNHEGANCRIIYKLVNLLSGKVECSFLKESEKLGTQSQSLFSEYPKQGVSIIFWCFIVGFFFGVMGYLLGLSLIAWI